MAMIGRPKKSFSKNTRITVRLTDKETEYLQYLTGKTGETITDIVGKSLRMMWNLEKNKV